MATDYVKKADLTQIKTLTAPPKSVKEVLMATALIMGYDENQVKDDRHIRRMIGSPTFLDDLKKTETCPPEVAKVARGLIEPLNEDMLAKNYKAIVGLFKWNSAILGKS